MQIDKYLEVNESDTPITFANAIIENVMNQYQVNTSPDMEKIRTNNLLDLEEIYKHIQVYVECQLRKEII